MSGKNSDSPPKWPLTFLKFFVRKEFLEEIEGDMEEIFNSNLAIYSVRKARRLYVREVLMLLRPILLRNLKGTHKLNFYDMFKHNLLLTYRSFKKYKNSFFINLIGLSTGFTCLFLIFLWVNDEINVDQFFENGDQLYQVMHNIPDQSGINTIGATPAKLGDALLNEFAEVEFATSVIPPEWYSEAGIISVDDKKLKAREQYASRSYFDVFPFELIAGNSQNLLDDKKSMAISDEMAIRLFNTTDQVVGKLLQWTREGYSGQYLISGIFRKPPKQSTQQFDLIVNIDLFLEEHTYLEEWGNNDPLTYIVLNENSNPGVVNGKIKDFIQTKIKNSESDLFIQKFSDRYLYSNYNNGQINGGRIQYVKLFSIIAILVLVIAAINFVNLSTAKASRRLKEIGVKKAIGASRRALIYQYLSESLLMAFLSLIVAVVFTWFFLPVFNKIVLKELTIIWDLQIISFVLGITFFTGILSGIYPAFYLSSFNTIKVLKGIFNSNLNKGNSRRGLVVFQFSISIMLIISVLVVYQQMNYIQSKNLGYERENIIYFNNEGPLYESLSAFIEEVDNIPGVVSTATFSHDLFGNHGNTSAVAWKGKDVKQKIDFGNIEAGYGFIETLGIEMVAGRSYDRSFQSEMDKIIFNESAIAAMGMTDPIGKTIRLWGQELQIIGVTKDFHFESLYKSVSPCFMLLAPESEKTMVKFKGANVSAVINQLHDLYKNFNDNLPFEYQYLESDYARLYESENLISSLSWYFCGLAILISCLGLFGLVAFTTERRIKELGIRKILGSGNWRIVLLLSRDFTVMLVISILIATPLSYLITENWLSEFSYRIELEWWFFVGSGLSIMLIAWLAVSTQLLKAANINPSECLRNE